MENAVELNIKGIKCDNPECDFKDDNVKFEDYEQWINKPCPKCGLNLLTQEDFDNTKMIIDIVSMANKVFPKRKEDEKIVTANIEMDGTGKVDFKIQKD